MITSFEFFAFCLTMTYFMLCCRYWPKNHTDSICSIALAITSGLTTGSMLYIPLIAHPQSSYRFQLAFGSFYPMSLGERWTAVVLGSVSAILVGWSAQVFGPILIRKTASSIHYWTLMERRLNIYQRQLDNQQRRGRVVTIPKDPADDWKEEEKLPHNRLRGMRYRPDKDRN